MWTYRYDPYTLMHYASEYYDPKKAHEYYEQHKQLKGNTKVSTVGLSAEGKRVASYVRNQINEKRSKKLSEEEERAQKEREIRQDAQKRTMEQHRMIMNQRITSLQNLLKRMTPQQRKDKTAKILYTIQKLREDNDKKRESLQNKYKEDSMKITKESMAIKKGIKEEAKKTYQNELTKIYKESKYQKKTRSNSSSSSAGYQKFTD